MTEIKTMAYAFEYSCILGHTLTRTLAHLWAHTHTHSKKPKKKNHIFSAFSGVDDALPGAIINGDRIHLFEYVELGMGSFHCHFHF